MGGQASDAQVLRRPVPLWLVVVGLLVTAGFTYLAVRNANLPDVWHALRESRKVWLVPAAAVLAAAVFVRAARWWLLFTPDSRPPLRAVVHSTLLGYFFNNVLPLRAGEAARVLAIHSRVGVSRAEAAGTVAVERAYDVLALLVLLFAVVPWLPAVPWLKTAVVLLLCLVVGVAAAIAVLARFGSRPLRFALQPLAWSGLLTNERVEGGALRLSEGLAGLRRPRMALEAGLATVVSWLLVALSFWLVMLGFDFGLSPLAGLLAVIAINLALILPSSPAAIGVFEWAAVIALDAYGVPRSQALSYALVAHALNFLPFVAVGLVLLHAGAGFRLPPWRSGARASR